MTKVTRLLGGHRNDVFKTNGFVRVIWKDGSARREQIREGVLLENFVATHTDIKARMLIDKAKPVQEENGEFVTHFRYVDGEIRYPWNLREIASAGKLLTRLHECFKDCPSRTRRTVLNRFSRQLHLDFARGNVLFQPGTPTAIGVIDFETTAVGPVERELGRTLSFLLVDTPITSGKQEPFVPSSGRGAGSGKFMKTKFRERMSTFLTNYGLTYKSVDVLQWAIRYLREEDYGNLNPVRDRAIEFLVHSSPFLHPAS